MPTVPGLWTVVLPLSTTVKCEKTIDVVLYNAAKTTILPGPSRRSS